MHMKSEFSKKLRKIASEQGLSQKDICSITGGSRASVSQWLSGKNVPPEKRREEIAISLGLEPDYFYDPTTDEDPPVIQHLSINDTALIMGMDKETIRQGLKDQRFPWGYAVKTASGRWVYWINKKKLYQIECIKEEHENKGTDTGREGFQ